VLSIFSRDDDRHLHCVLGSLGRQREQRICHAIGCADMVAIE
jgi:hypothetical protein